MWSFKINKPFNLCTWIWYTNSNYVWSIKKKFLGIIAYFNKKWWLIIISVLDMNLFFYLKKKWCSYFPKTYFQSTIAILKQTLERTLFYTQFQAKFFKWSLIQFSFFKITWKILIFKKNIHNGTWCAQSYLNN